MKLTKKQKEVLDYIEAFMESRGYAPSMREIAEGLGLRSVATVHQHVAALVDKGALRRSGANRKRDLEPVAALKAGGSPTGGGVFLPLVGTIRAGQPIEAVEMEDEIEIPESLLSGGTCFVLRVQGDSMIDDGIRDGDLIVVRSQSTAEAGQTVVALVNGEATLKRFYRRGEVVELRPANQALKPFMVSAREVEIRGVVVSLLRRFR